MTRPFAQRRVVAAIVAAACTIACHTTHDPARDHTLVIALAAEPTVLFPPVIDETPGIVITDLILERLADPGPTLDILNDAAFRPRLADRWTWAPDSLSIAFHLAQRARWHDGAPVSAHDVRFTFDVYRDTTIAALAAPLLANIDSVQARDDLTAVFWFHHREPLQFFDATYHIRILPRHILDTVPRRRLRDSRFARAPVGTGPFRFARWHRGQIVELEANERYHGRRARFDRLVFAITSDPEIAFTRAMAGEIDVVPNLRAADVAPAARARRLYTVRWPSLSSGLILLDLQDATAPRRAHPLLGDLRVRRAITMALDRRRIARGALGETAAPAVGPLPAALMRDPSVALLPFDTARAAWLLDAAGWRTIDPDGPRRNGSRALRFTLLVPTGSIGARRVAVIAQEQLRGVGVAMDIEATDLASLGDRVRAHRFDAALVALDWDPSPLSARQLWGSAAGTGDANFSGYHSSAFDTAIGAAAAARDPATARARAASAFEQLVRDAPAIWLYDLRQIVAVRAGVRPAPGRPDAWWSALADWSVADDSTARGAAPES